jgi:dihydrolipoamide dehydrogenase
MQVVVIGGGPAGVSAALHAAELGAEVTLVERGRIGGTAFNSGPAPVRTLARGARLVRDWSSWETFGLRGPRPQVDLAATLANAQRVSDNLYERKRVADHIRSVGVDVVEEAGNVGFIDANTIAAADGRTWTADRVIIAVGGRAGRLPIRGAELGLTYEDVRAVTSLPERVCIIGAADTGCQLASLLADLGCEVTVVEHASRIVPRADTDISVALQHAFIGRGIKVITDAAVQELESPGSGVRVHYRASDKLTTIDVDAAFFAVSWPGNADLVDAAAAGITTEGGYVTVDAFMATNLPHIFAAGDVDGTSMLVSSATLEGRVAAENAVLGPRRRVAHEIVPTGSFTDPEYGSVGLTEEQARARYDCTVAAARYEDMLRPVADGQPEGFCKLIVETTRRQIVGTHVFGEYSAEVVQMVATCMAAGMRIEDVAELQFAFPTFTEGVGQAAQMVVNQLGIRPMPHLWSSLNLTPSVVE